MSYPITKPQKAIIKAIKEFAKGEFDKELILEHDKNSKFSSTTWKKIMELGFIGIHMPEAYNGGGMGMLENILVAETFARCDSTLGSSIMFSLAGIECLNYFGSENQKETFLSPILEGIIRSSILNPCFINGRYKDLFIVKKAEDDEWIINGQINNVINSPEADLLILPVTGNKTPQEMVILLIDVSGPNVSINQEETLGLRITPISTVTLKNVIIPKENRISVNGKKTGVIETLQSEFRLLVSGIALGIAKGAMDRAITHVKQREQFGTKLVGFQVIQHKLAQMEIKIIQAESLTCHAASCYNHKKPDYTQIASAVICATETAIEVSNHAIQLLGGYGYTTEYDVERCYRDAKTLQIMKGSRSDLYDEIAGKVL
jgi:alkylation response protein AidB-like acyl-CoA dehydrogenase